MLMGPAANMQFLYKSEKNVAPAVAAAPPLSSWLNWRSREKAKIGDRS